MGSATHPLFGHLDDPVHMALFYAWWHPAGRRGMPAETDVDFEDLAPIMPHIGLIDVLDDGRRFRHRHLGPWTEALLSCDASEDDLDETAGEPQLVWLRDLYGDVVRRQSPIYAECVYRSENVRRIWTMRLLLPLSGDRDNVDTLIYSVSFAPCRARIGRNDRIVDVLEAKRVIFERCAGHIAALELAFGALQL
jgi:hypothetical protein